jgi:hypothetical protein
MELLVTGTELYVELSLKGRKAISSLWYHRTGAAYHTMPDADGGAQCGTVYLRILLLMP